MKHQARKRFGQNFLQDDFIIDSIIDALNPQSHEHIVEIGPGRGALTQSLVNSGAQLDLIELDRDLIENLNKRCQDRDNIHIHNVDVLKFDFTSLTTSPDRLRIIGNLPYNISTPLIFHLLDTISLVHDMHFMLQKEVVQRLAAEPGNKHYGRLGIMVQYFCQVEYLLDVPPESFTPAPKVDSAVVRLTPHKEITHQANDFTIFKKLVTQAFSQRRKTLRNNLKGTLSDAEIISIDIDPSARAEILSLQQFVELSNLLKNI